MKCPMCHSPLIPMGGPHPTDGQFFGCDSHRGYGFYASELRSRGHGAFVDEELAEQSRRVEEGRAAWARQAGYATWDEARAAATLNGEPTVASKERD